MEAIIIEPPFVPPKSGAVDDVVRGEEVAFYFRGEIVPATIYHVHGRTLSLTYIAVNLPIPEIFQSEFDKMVLSKAEYKNAMIGYPFVRKI